jgi:hypothetical protein
MSTPQDKLKDYLEAQKGELEKKTDKASKKRREQVEKIIKSPSYQGLTYQQAQEALGPEVGGSTETRGTGQYQYQYKTAPPKYIGIGTDGKPIINPVYREGKLGSVFLATNLALQNAGGAQADPFSKLGATLAGVFGGIFMKNIGADINYYRASEQVKAENKEAIATSAAGARADSASLTYLKSAWKFGFDQKMGEINQASREIKLADEQLDFAKKQYAVALGLAKANPFGEDEDVAPHVKSRLDSIKKSLLYKMGYTEYEINSSGGLGAFNDGLLAGAKVKDYGNIKIFEDENGMPLGPVFVGGQLVASSNYAKILQQAISNEHKVNLEDVGEAWDRATTFVDGNSAVKQELNKFSGKAKTQHRFGLIKSYANEIVKRAQDKDNNTAIMIGDTAYTATQMFSGFELNTKKPARQSTPVTPTKSDSEPPKVTSPLALQFASSKDDSDIQKFTEFSPEGDQALNDRINAETDQQNKAALLNLQSKKAAIKAQYTNSPSITVTQNPAFKDSDVKEMSKYINWYETINNGVIPVNRDALDQAGQKYFDAYQNAVKQRTNITTNFIDTNKLVLGDYTVGGDLFYAPKEARKIGAKGNAIMVSLKPLSLLRHEGEEYGTLLRDANTIINGAILAFTNQTQRAQELSSVLTPQQVSSQLSIEKELYKQLTTNGRYLQPIPNDAQNRNFYFVYNDKENQVEIYLAKVPK